MIVLYGVEFGSHASIGHPKTSSLDDRLHNKDQSISTAWYNLGSDGSSPNSDKGIIMISDQYPMNLGASKAKDQVEEVDMVNHVSVMDWWSESINKSKNMQVQKIDKQLYK